MVILYIRLINLLEIHQHFSISSGSMSDIYLPIRVRNFSSPERPLKLVIVSILRLSKFSYIVRRVFSWKWHCITMCVTFSSLPKSHSVQTLLLRVSLLSFGVWALRLLALHTIFAMSSQFLITPGIKSEICHQVRYLGLDVVLKSKLSFLYKKLICLLYRY